MHYYLYLLENNYDPDVDLMLFSVFSLIVYISIVTKVKVNDNVQGQCVFTPTHEHQNVYHNVEEREDGDDLHKTK